MIPGQYWNPSHNVCGRKQMNGKLTAKSIRRLACTYSHSQEYQIAVFFVDGNELICHGKMAR